MLDRSSKSRLTPRQSELFPGETLFARIARAVCEAGCLPRKELFEAWEVARRVHRRARGGRRVIDLACGHGLLAQVLLLLDESAPGAIAADVRIPKSASELARVLSARWPRLIGKLELCEAAIEAVPIDAGDLVVSAHACGALTDAVLERAIAARATVAVLPCCQDHNAVERESLDGWLDPSLAIDVRRALRLEAAGYDAFTQTIPGAITPKNRLLIGLPR